MPLLDHFHPPLYPDRNWEGFHSRWGSGLSDLLNDRLLPQGYFAEPHVHVGAAIEVDAAVREQFGDAFPLSTGTTTATLPARPWAPPEATLTIPMAFIDTFEVQVYSPQGAMKLVAIIEIVSPANKDRPDARRAFAVKCASLLNQGIGLLVVDIVTDRLANLHDDIVRLLPEGESHRFPGSPALYAAAYRPVRTRTVEQAQVWLNPLAVGDALPPMPLWLSDGPCLRIDLEETYTDACRRLRLLR